MTTPASSARPSAVLLSRAATQLTALASPVRLAVLSALLRREQAGLAGGLTELAAELGLDVRVLARHATALESAGLVRLEGHRLRSDLGAATATAEALLAELPVTALLQQEPGLARFFAGGRLTALPVVNRVEERRRLAELLVRLVPEDRSLSEAEVNGVLAEVGDDVAALRRFLVEEGVLSRRGAADYRRRPV